MNRKKRNLASHSHETVYSGTSGNRAILQGLNTRVEECAREVTALKGKTMTLEEGNKDLEKRLGAVDDRFDQTVQERQHLNKTVEDLNQHIQGLNSTFIHNIQAAVRPVSQSVTALTQEIAELNASLVAKLANLKNLSQRVDVLTSVGTLDKTPQPEHPLRHEHTHLAGRVAALESNMKTTPLAQQEAIDTRLQAIQESIETTRRVVNQTHITCNARLEELERDYTEQLQGQQSTLQALDERYRQLGDRLDNIPQPEHPLRHEHTHLAGRVAALESNMKTTLAQQYDINTTLGKHQKNLHDQAINLGQLEVKNANFSTQLAALKTLPDTIRRITVQQEKQGSTGLQEKVTTNENQLAENTHRIQQLQDELSVQQQRLTALQSNHQSHSVTKPAFSADFYFNTQASRRKEDLIAALLKPPIESAYLSRIYDAIPDNCTDTYVHLLRYGLLGDNLYPMHTAACVGRLDTLQAYLNTACADINWQDNQGRTFLLLTVGEEACGNSIIFRFLLNQTTIDVNPVDHAGNSFLHHTARLGRHAMMVEWILHNLKLGNPLNIDAVNHLGQTPVFLAAANDHILALSALIQKGAEVNLQTLEGYTPLHIAAFNDYPVIVSQLLAQPTISLCLKTASSRKRLDEMAGINSRDLFSAYCLETLKPFGDWVAFPPDDPCQLYCLLQSARAEACPASLMRAPYYLLHAIVRNGSLELFNQIEEYYNRSIANPVLCSINWNMQDSQGNTLFLAAVQSSSPNDSLVAFVTAQLLQMRISSPHYVNAQGESALGLAVAKNLTRTVSILIPKTSVNSADKAGNTPLHIAARESYLQIVEYLLNAGAAVNMLNKAGEFPADLAILGCHRAIVQRLLGCGAPFSSIPPDHCAQDIQPFLSAFHKNKGRSNVHGQLTCSDYARLLINRDKRDITFVQSNGSPPLNWDEVLAPFPLEKNPCQIMRYGPLLSADRLVVLVLTPLIQGTIEGAGEGILARIVSARFLVLSQLGFQGLCRTLYFNWVGHPYYLDYSLSLVAVVLQALHQYNGYQPLKFLNKHLWRGLIASFEYGLPHLIIDGLLNLQSFQAELTQCGINYLQQQEANAITYLSVLTAQILIASLIKSTVYPFVYQQVSHKTVKTQKSKSVDRVAGSISQSLSKAYYTVFSTNTIGFFKKKLCHAWSVEDMSAMQETKKSAPLI
jgi:ankyrin repeat protein